MGDVSTFDTDTESLLQEANGIPAEGVNVQFVSAPYDGGNDLERHDVLFNPQGSGENCFLCLRSYFYWQCTLLYVKDIWLRANEGYFDMDAKMECEYGAITWIGNIPIKKEICPVNIDLNVSGICVAAEEWSPFEFEVDVFVSRAWQLVTEEEKRQATAYYIRKNADWSPLAYQYQGYQDGRHKCQGLALQGDIWKADEETIKKYRRAVLL